MKGKQHYLVHTGVGWQCQITNTFSLIAELRYDQAFPKYLDNEFPEVLDWYSASVGLKYTVSPHVMIRASVTVGFRNSIVLWPESKSTFDLAKETLQVVWSI